jgi:hypothetical protein
VSNVSQLARSEPVQDCEDLSRPAFDQVAHDCIAGDVHRMDEPVDDQHSLGSRPHLGVIGDKRLECATSVPAEQVLVFEPCVIRTSADAPVAIRTLRRGVRRLTNPQKFELRLTQGATHQRITDGQHVQATRIQPSAHFVQQLRVLNAKRVAAIELDDPAQRYLGRKAR